MLFESQCCRLKHALTAKTNDICMYIHTYIYIHTRTHKHPYTPQCRRDLAPKLEEVPQRHSDIGLDPANQIPSLAQLHDNDPRLRVRLKEPGDVRDVREEPLDERLALEVLVLSAVRPRERLCVCGWVGGCA